VDRIFPRSYIPHLRIHSRWRDHLRRQPAEPGYIVAFIMLGSFTLGIGQFVVIRGYSAGNRAVVGLLLICLIAGVLTYPFSHDALLAVVSVIAPLLSLLAYNSRRYREMSKTLSDIRRNRFKPVSGKR
jgi:hypothetical protein